MTHSSILRSLSAGLLLVLSFSAAYSQSFPSGGGGGGGGGSGTVTSFSFTDANGLSGSVATPTSTPTLTLTPSPITISGQSCALGGTCTIPTATVSSLGLVQPDNSTITISAGVITAVGGGGGSGTVNSGTAGQIATYSTTGAAVSGLTLVPVTAGGTGLGTFTSGCLLEGNGTGNLNCISNVSSTVLIGGASAPSFSSTPSVSQITAGDIVLTSTTTPANGANRSATNTVSFFTNSTNAGSIDPTQHWRFGNSTAPTIASGACGTLTNGTISAAGGTASDQDMIVNIGAVATTVCAISFGSTETTAPRACVMTAGNAAAIAITTLAYLDVTTISTTGFSIKGSVLASTIWAVHCS